VVAAKQPRVHVAEGGGVPWRDTTQAEAMLFLAPMLQVCKEPPRHRGSLHRGIRPVKRCGEHGARKFASQEDLQGDGQKCRSGKAPLVRRLTPCLPWPVLMPPAPASSSRSRAFYRAAAVAKDLHDECKAGIVDFGQKHIARYGGRLLGGSRRAPASLGMAQMGAPEQLLLFATSFEGVLDGSNYLPTFYLLKDQFHYDPVNISLTFGFIMMPWLLKPALALLSDRVTVLGRRRTPYITVSALIIAGGFMGAGTLASAGSVVGSLCCLTIGRTLLGSAVQGILVEVGRDRDHDGTTKLVADFFLLRAVAAVCSSIVTTVSVSRLGPRRTFRLFALLPAMIFAAVIQYEVLQSRAVGGQAEEIQEDLHEFSLHGLRNMMTIPAVWGPLVFLFVYNVGPNYDDPLYFYFINKLQFEPYMVGQLQIAHALAKVMGIFLYRFALIDVEDRTLIVAMTALSCPLMLSPLLLTTGAYKYLLINPRVLALSGELVRELFIQIQMMPPMARWVQLTPKGYEGTMVSLLISTIHLSRASSKLTSASVANLIGVTSTNFRNISVLITVCGGSTLIPILFAHELIPDVSDVGDGDDPAGSLHIEDISDTSTGAGTGLAVSDARTASSTQLDTRHCERQRRNDEEGCSNIMPAG